MTKADIAQLTKLYYSIGEVSDMFQVNTSLLRFWEKEFKFTIVKKNQKGNRLYSIKEIEQIRKIYQLVKIEGYTLDGAKQRLRTPSRPHENPPQSTNEIVERLENLKQRLIILKTL